MDIGSPSGRRRVDAAFRAGCELVAQADVGEGAADHDFVIAATRAVGVKSAGFTPWSVRYFPAGPLSLMEPAGEMWSVVTEVAEDGENAGAEISWTGAGCAGMPSKYGALRM